MKILLQLCVVFAICLLGEGLSIILPFPIPGTVISMVILFLLFLFKILKVDQIQESAGFFVKNMALFFIPASVGLLESYSKVSDQVWVLLAITTIAAFLTYTVTIFTVTGAMKIQKYFSKRKDSHT